MQASQQKTTKKHVMDLKPGDILVGKQGGHSIIEDSSDTSGLLGFVRVETEHGQLYMELDKEVTVLVLAK